MDMWRQVWTRGGICGGRYRHVEAGMDMWRKVLTCGGRYGHVEANMG